MVTALNTENFLTGEVKEPTLKTDTTSLESETKSGTCDPLDIKCQIAAPVTEEMQTELTKEIEATGGTAEQQVQKSIDSKASTTPTTTTVQPVMYTPIGFGGAARSVAEQVAEIEAVKELTSPKLFGLPRNLVIGGAVLAIGFYLYKSGYFSK
jgi:hypothetical protein